MNVLIGVIETSKGEQLFTVTDGVCRLIAAAGRELEKKFPNYEILKKRSLKINDEPVSGSGVFNFRYGPVMAGVKEAGSFNLFTYGEKILQASINLEWKHRGIETAMKGKEPESALLLAERVCSNFAVAHSIAFSHSVEDALNLEVDFQTTNWRIVLLEMERVYNHLNVIYKLASAAAQKVLAAHLCSLFEEALRLNEQLTGSRYLMAVNGIGRMQKVPHFVQIEKAINGYGEIVSRFEELYRHSLNNSNYLDRLHDSGTLTPKMAIDLGITGPSLRACGVEENLNGMQMQRMQLPSVTQNEGDALARMETRAEEIINSGRYIIDHLKVSDTWGLQKIAAGPNLTAGESCGMSNSASGALGYYIRIENGIVDQVKICTPSYPGMHAASATLKNQIFTDFPFVFDSFGIHFSDAAI